MPASVQLAVQPRRVELSRSDPTHVPKVNVPATQLGTLDKTLPKEDKLVRPEPHKLRLRQEWKLAKGPTAPPRQAPATEGFEAARDQLQRALATLKDRPHDGKRQEAAHDAQAALAQQPIPRGHRALPALHKALQIGLAGSVPTFGVGRTLGVQYGTDAVPVGPTPGVKNIQRAAAQLALGAVGGAIGNLAGKTLVAPLVDRLPRQFRPIDPAATLPDRMVSKMNRIRSGWGDATRATIIEQQKEIVQINSDTNIHCAEKAFSLATAARVLIQPRGFKPTLPLSIASSSAASGLAGAAVGANMAGNMARAEVRVPRQETLDRVLASNANEWHEDAVMADAQRLPLFYSHHLPARERREPAKAIMHKGHQVNMRDPAPKSHGPTDPKPCPDWRVRAHGFGADVRSTALSAVSRSEYMMQATAGPVAIGAAQPYVAASMPNAISARMSGVLLPVIAVKLVIRPWFNALFGGIPARDAELRAQRQQAAIQAETGKPRGK